MLVTVMKRNYICVWMARKRMPHSGAFGDSRSLCQDIVRTDFDEMEEVPEIVKLESVML